MPEEAAPLNIAGNAVADTPTLILLAANAVTADFEYQLPRDIIHRLDPDGKHILCIRPHLMPDAESDLRPDGTGRSRLDTTLGTPLPCEIMLKLKGQKAAVHRMLSVKVYDYTKLEQLWGATPDMKLNIFEGQRRTAKWN